MAVRFAVMSGDVVSNVIIAESTEQAEALSFMECIESNEAQVGWIVDRETGLFAEPEPEVIEPTPVEEENA